MYRPEDYPQIRDHLYLKGRGKGASKVLTGKVALITVYMSRKSSDWSESVRDAYVRSVWTAIEALQKEAVRYGASLSITPYHFDHTVSPKADPHDKFNLIKDRFDVTTMEQLQTKYEKHLGVDEAIFVLAFDGEGRSFASRQKSNGPVDEISVVFIDSSRSENSMAYTIAHELLHQFGAADYYFPGEMESLATRYFGKTIMNDHGCLSVDELTAYLVGWTDTVTAYGWWFMKESMWLTEEVWQKALDDIWAKEKKKK